jgi:DNA modification methylase
MTSLLINANALHIPLADKSVNCVVTSPPYYGLRDYGTAKWEGGDPNCDHCTGFTDTHINPNALSEQDKAVRAILKEQDDG